LRQAQKRRVSSVILEAESYQQRLLNIPTTYIALVFLSLGAVKAWISFLFFGRGMMTDGAGLSVIISVTRSESPGAIWDNSWLEPSRKRENIAVAAALSFVNCGVQGMSNRWRWKRGGGEEEMEGVLRVGCSNVEGVVSLYSRFYITFASEFPKI
jgi:hypothetical protein